MKHQVHLPVISLSKDDPGVILVLFNRKVKLCKIGLSTGKNENSGFSESFGAGDLKFGRRRQLI